MAKLHTFFKTILYILAVILLILSLNNAKQSFKVSMKNKNLKNARFCIFFQIYSLILQSVRINMQK